MFTITQNGLNLLNQTRADGTVQFWIGYFGLAYVPDEKRNLPEETNCWVDNKLTTNGDTIYNLMQGAMTPVGFDTDIGDSAASKLYNECMYTGNVMSKFRYVINPEDGSNRLVVFADVNDFDQGETLDKGVFEYTHFNGATVESNSELPIPAPLYYLGEPVDYANPQSIGDNVSCDTRFYLASDSSLPNPEIGTDSWVGAGKYDWAKSQGNTYSDHDAITNRGTFTTLSDYWQYQSVSNFNRFHAPANTAGFDPGTEPACRNMAKATKLFPISHYDVISTADDVTVSNVQYTVLLDLSSVFSKISNRSTNYYEFSDNDFSKIDESNPYPLSFKFNRIGIYAVPVTLHTYNKMSENCTGCDNDVVQMQIIGNEEPILFAVRDMDSPVIVSEDGIAKYEFKFRIKFDQSNRLVNSSAIFYNLYEDDAITWYKNQLIANASTADAVTNLGIQISYLRQQMNQMSDSEGSCGIIEEGDSFVYDHGLRNIVDTAEFGNGAVKGIYTETEQNKILLYKSNGRHIELNSSNEPYYPDYPDQPIETLINVPNYMLGTDSVALGRDSATAGSYSLNLTDYGILGGNNSGGVLMLGGIPKDDSKLDAHYAVDDTRNSIINVGDTAEIQHMDCSLWMVSGASDVTNRSTFVDYKVQNSIGIGMIDAYANDWDALVYNASPVGKTINSMFLGQASLYSYVHNSIMAIDAERGNRVNVGRINLMSGLNSAALMTGSTDFDTIFAHLHDGVEYSLIQGLNTQVDRDVNATISVGYRHKIANSTHNTIMVGSAINTEPPQRTPVIFTVDEFNDKYAGQFVAADDNTFRREVNDIPNYMAGIVIGDGTIYGKNQDTSSFEHDVHGVTLYIFYENDAWTVDDFTGDTDSKYDALNSYQISGHDIKNMVILGDSNSVGYDSINSVIIGDEAANKRIIYKNSFINIGDSVKSYTTDDTTGDDLPVGIFNNVWWIGHNYSDPTYVPDPTITDSESDSHTACADVCRYGNIGNFICNGWRNGTHSDLTEFQDVFAFVGRNNKQFGFASWFGASNEGASYLEQQDLTGWEDYTYKDLYQPCKAPMIYSGGIALGGYGTPDSNFMLLKIGIRGCWTGDESGLQDGSSSMWTPKYSEFRKIVYLKDGHVQNIKEDKVINVDGLYDLYDDYCSDGIHHLQVDSPFAGQVLMVQDRQELDGTLHVGLGGVADALYGQRNIVTLTSRYVNNTVAFHVSCGRQSFGDIGYDFSYNNTSQYQDNEIFYVDPITLYDGIRFAMKCHFETPIGAISRDLHIDKIWLEVSMDHRYMVYINDEGNFTTTTNHVVVDNANINEIVCADGYKHLPTYVCLQNDAVFKKLWHLCLGLGYANVTGAYVQPTSELVTVSSPHVYKVTPISWMDNSQLVHMSYVYWTNTASPDTIAATVEDVTATEAVHFM